jgi:Ca-activated chloride channel family protein
VLRDLEQLAPHTGRATLCARVSALLKRVALARYARSEVAALSGRAWLAFLDRTGGGGKFEHGPGQVLASGPYAPDCDSGTPSDDSEALIALSKSWVRRNL